MNKDKPNENELSARVRQADLNSAILGARATLINIMQFMLHSGLSVEAVAGFARMDVSTLEDLMDTDRQHRGLSVKASPELRMSHKKLLSEYHKIKKENEMLFMVLKRMGVELNQEDQMGEEVVTLDTTIDKIGLTSRAQNALYRMALRAGINRMATVRDVVSKTEFEISKMPSVGEKTLLEIMYVLGKHGFRLRQP